VSMRISLESHALSLPNFFLCMLPMSLAQSSSASPIGRTGVTEVQCGRSVIYDCLVENCNSLQ